MSISATPHVSRPFPTGHNLVWRSFVAPVRFLRALSEAFAEARAMQREAERAYPYLRFDR